MLYDDSLVFCLKIAQQEWIKRLKDGSAWFGKINNYIEKAIEADNDDQGDRYEGIFARTLKRSSLVEKYSVIFGDDLEIIDDGEYCFLRRKSSKLQKAFCTYGIRKSELEITEVINPDDETPLCRFQYFISPRMYNGFLQDGSAPADVAGFYCSAGHLNSAIEQALRSAGYRWKRDMIEYDIDLSQEFFIEPLDGYPELWHKRVDLAYQHESRIVIYDYNDEIKGIPLPYTPLSENSGNWAPGELYLQGEATAYRIK